MPVSQPDTFGTRIDDPEDPRLRPYNHLTDPGLRRGFEAAEQLFIAEGRTVVLRLLRSPYPVRSVLLTDRSAARARSWLGDVPCPVLVVPEELARRVTGFHLHRGVLACGGRLPAADWRSVVAGSSTVLVVEDMADQTNLGSLFRSAMALGADAVVLSPGCCDPLYRRTVRVSMGASLSIPFAYMTGWPEPLDGLAQTHELLALTPGTGARSLAEVVADRDASLRGSGDPRPPRLALMVGAEGPGLTEAALAAASDRVRIPMRPGSDSLNVATAAAVALSHLVAVHPG